MSESSNNDAMHLEREKLRLEVSKHRTETAKWIVIAIGAVASFWIIDRGKLNIERQKTSADVVKLYLESTNTPDPDMWRRKLEVIEGIAEEDRIRTWATSQIRNLTPRNTLAVLCQETLRVATRLIDLSHIDEPSRLAARIRFEELYWADLVYAKETAELERAMVVFKRALDAAETDRSETNSVQLRQAMLVLAKALREAPDAQATNRL